MKNALYEPHNIPDIHLPFIFHTDTVHRGYSYSNWHNNPEFLYCIEGSGSVMCDSKKLDFCKGDTVIINSRVLHSIVSQDFVKYRCLIIDCTFFEENVIPSETIRFFDHTHDAEAGELMERIVDAYHCEKSDFYVALIRRAVLNFLMYICLHYTVTLTGGTEKRSSKSAAAILQVVDYINNNYSQNLSLSDLSAVAGFSKYHFARIFKENTGYTVVEYINAMRCEQAKHLLCETSSSISEICSLCGFDNASYFSKTFRSYTGFLPSEYRRSNAGGKFEYEYSTLEHKPKPDLGCL